MSAEPKISEKVRETSKKAATSTTTTSANAKREVYYTPDSAFEVLEPYLKNYKAIWDPAAGADKFPVKEYFEKKGFRVATTDILMGKEYDFFSHKTKKRYDIIVTTPPYSFRKEFIIRACDLKKPFAFLVPVNVLESKTVRDLFKQYAISLIFPPKTTNFSSPDDSKSVKALPYCVWAVGGIPNIGDVVYL